MADLRVYIANCLVAGHTFTTDGQGRLRDTIELSCDGKTLVLKQAREVVSGGHEIFRGQFAETTQVLVKNVTPTEVEQVLIIVDRICWLLSFAGLSRVVRYGHDYLGEGIDKNRRTIVDATMYFRPTLEIHDGGLIKGFIEQTYPIYKEYEADRKLNVAIDYLLQAERPSIPTECKLVFAFVLLENLKHTFARSKRIPFIKGFFRKSPDFREQYNFAELLNMMFSEVGMNPNLEQVIDLRNEILHSGLSARSHKESWGMYENIHDIIREYLLRILGYKGEYWLYSNEGGAKIE